MRVAVVGAAGSLAAAVIKEFEVNHEVIGFTRADLDVSDDRAVSAAMDRVRPHVIVNGSAFNDVDGAEDRPVDALNVNAFAVRALASAACDCGATLVHYSTDFVFDGLASIPYREQDRVSPRSTYAMSKLLGEWFAADAPRAYVLRVESLFGRPVVAGSEKGSVAGIVRTLQAGGTAKVFVDRAVSPTYIPDAAAATRWLIESEAAPGLYHCVNSGSCSWFEFAQELSRLMKIEARLEPVRMSELKLRASRPLYCVLSNEKLQQTGMLMPPWQDALRRYVDLAPATAGRD